MIPAHPRARSLLRSAGDATPLSRNPALALGQAPICYNPARSVMDFDHLITFLEIAKQGSFSRAGQKLYRSQPAVSAQIRQLEQEYGQKLFDRVGKSVRLTVAGETLQEFAGRLLLLRNESLRAVGDQATTPRGTP